MASGIQLNSTNNSEMNIVYQGTSGATRTVVVPDKNMTVAGTDEVIGVGQTWQSAELTNTGALFTDGTPKYRVSGTTYTNNTGKPIQVSVYSGNTATITIIVSGITILILTASSSFANGATFIVPNGVTYSATSFQFWSELR